MGERLTFGYGTSSQGGDAPSRDSAGPTPPAPHAAHTARPEPVRRDWAYMGLLAFTACLFFRPQDQITPLQPLHLAEVSAVLGLIAMVIGRLSRGLPITRVTPELAGVVALGGVIILTAPFSIWTGGAISTFTELYVKVILIFLLMVNTLLWPKRIEQVTWLIVLATGYIAFRAVFDYARGINLIENGRVRGAIGGMFQNSNDLALNMVAILPLALSFVFRRISLVRRGIAVACTGLMFMTIVASQSRSGSLDLGAVLIVMAVLTLRRKPGLVAAGVMVAILAVPMLPDSYWARLASITDGSKDETGSREARSILMREAYQAFLDHPLTGVGAGQFKNYQPEGRDVPWLESHNAILQIAAELGVFGLLCFLYLLYRALYAPMQTRQLLKRFNPGRRRGVPPTGSLPADEQEFLTSHAAALSAALVGWFVCSIFASVAYHWTLYYLMALAMSPREYLADRLTTGRPTRRRREAQTIVAEAHA
jgi:putative inorganic carbon (hco3(-)) transporter